MNYRVTWIEHRLHYVEIEAENEFDAIEKSADFDYEVTTTDDSWYGDRSAKPIREEE